MKLLVAALLVVPSFVANSSFAQTPAPQEKPTEKPKVTVYDESADAKKVIADALAKAKKENRRVLIQWGANWCGWCVKLHELYKSDAKISRKLMYEYDVVYVDIGESKDEAWKKNLDVAAQYGADFKSHGVPYLTVLDGDGKVITNQETGSLEFEDKDKAAHDPTKVLDFLTANQAAYLAAADVSAAAFARAKQENKRVFLHYGAPWCGWCHKLEDWMAQPAIASLLAKDFVELKIDQDRMTGGADMLAAQRASVGATGGGIPWIAFCSVDGKVLAHGDAVDPKDPKATLANIGFPVEEHEIAQFVKMLDAARVNLTADDVETLRKSLVLEHEKIEAARAKAKAAKPAAAGAQ